MKSIYKPIGNRGFTLIEVLIAGFLLVVAILGVISTTVIIIKSNSLSKEMTTATTLAKDKMEQLKNTNYDGLAGNTDYFDNDSQTTSAANSLYTRIWEINNGPGTGTPPPMKTIVVKVRWYWLSLLKEVILTSIVAQ